MFFCISDVREEHEERWALHTHYQFRRFIWVHLCECLHVWNVKESSSMTGNKYNVGLRGVNAISCWPLPNKYVISLSLSLSPTYTVIISLVLYNFILMVLDLVMSTPASASGSSQCGLIWVSVVVWFLTAKIQPFCIICLCQFACRVCSQSSLWPMVQCCISGQLVVWDEAL